MKKRKDRKNNPTIVFAVLMIFLLPVLIYLFVDAILHQKGLAILLGAILAAIIVSTILITVADHKMKK